MRSMLSKVCSGMLLALFFWSVSAAGLQAAQTVAVTDMAGRSVEAPLDPARIVCVGPGALRLIVYLQAEQKVVGVEDMEKINPSGRPYWLAHPELAERPRCGPGGPAGINKKPDLEAVLTLAPQVLFATYMEAPLADEVQRILDIPVVILSYGAFATFDTAVYDALRIAGRILNRSQRATAVIGYIESLRADLQTRTAPAARAAGRRRPLAYVGGIGYRGAHGIGSTERRYIPFEWVNARNAAEQVDPVIGSHVFLDKEILLRLDPDVIFIDGGGQALVAEDVRKKPGYFRALKAFAGGRVYTLLPFNFYTTNIGTAVADAYAIGKILYPAAFADVDPARKADAIYRFLVGKPVYAAMEKDYGAIGCEAPFLKALEEE